MIEKALSKPLPFNFFKTCLSVNEAFLGSVNIKLKNNNKYFTDKGHLPTRRALYTVQARVCARVCVSTVPCETCFDWCVCSVCHTHPGHVHKFGVQCRSPEICQKSGPDPKKPAVHGTWQWGCINTIVAIVIETNLQKNSEVFHLYMSVWLQQLLELLVVNILLAWESSFFDKLIEVCWWVVQTPISTVVLDRHFIKCLWQSCSCKSSVFFQATLYLEFK